MLKFLVPVASKPEDVSAQATGEGQVTLSWQMSDRKTQSSLKHFEVIVVPTQSSGALIPDHQMQDWPATHRRQEIKVTSVSQRDDPRYWHVIRKLRPDTHYIFYIRSMTDIGAGLKHVTKPIKTWAKIPRGKVRDFRVENKAVDFALSWQPPRLIDRCGFFSHYDITCNQIPLNLSANQPSFDWPAVQISAITLFPKAEGSFKCNVRAYSRAGQGPWSDPVRFHLPSFDHSQ
ncbi:hypothetical protein Ciccas_006013 [Cichlidogyrus casuarinus]|uniref:Fibronectin type-III domain-containing protein n=1 Tax=Cichlidogyrus casuarinus TaxID=1844966 RepID=A0ABD2Q718_9PLAT